MFGMFGPSEFSRPPEVHTPYYQGAPRDFWPSSDYPFTREQSEYAPPPEVDIDDEPIDVGHDVVDDALAEPVVEVDDVVDDAPSEAIREQPETSGAEAAAGSTIERETADPAHRDLRETTYLVPEAEPDLREVRGPEVEEIREPRVREVPDPIDRALRSFEQLRWSAEASFTPQAWAACVDRHRDVADLRVRVDDLITRLADLPLIADRDALIGRLRELSDSDVGGCLREIGRALEKLAPASAPVRCPRDHQTWIEWLEKSIEEVVERGEPSIVVLPAPDGRLDGRLPQRTVTDVEVRDSKAVMFGADATLTVVHQCEVTRPVIEIAALIDHSADGPNWGWWTVTPSLDPVVAGAATEVRSRVVSCSGVSIGNGNAQHTVIQHRMTSCPYDRDTLVSDHAVSAALVRCRDDSLDPIERYEAREQLRRVVSRFVKLTDASALIPDAVIAHSASSAGPLPTVRSDGAALTVIHGAGVAVGWRPTVTGETRTKVGHFQIR